MIGYEENILQNENLIKEILLYLEESHVDFQIRLGRVMHKDV